MSLLYFLFLGETLLIKDANIDKKLIDKTAKYLHREGATVGNIGAGVVQNPES